MNVPEELGNKQLFLKHQYSTGIFFYLLLLLSSILSTYRQTNEESVETDSADFLSFSRNELLHLLDALVVNDEEDRFLRYFILGERIFPCFNVNPIPSPNRDYS